MNQVRRLGIAFFVIAILTNCTPLRAQSRPDYWPTDGWRTTTPEEQGMDSGILANITKNIQEQQLPIHSLLIVRNGYLVTEVYGYPYSAGQAHWIASVTKSVMGALIGIAIEQGYIKNVDQPISELLPEANLTNLDESKEVITLKQFLTLTTGIKCQDYIDVPQMEGSTNWVDYVLSLPMDSQPGAKFNYCTPAIQVLSAILQNATGMSTRDFANQNLFSPIGVEPISETRWPSDPQGVTLGGYGLTLTPQEIAKFGYLILNKGKWDGKTIIPAKWVNLSTTGHIQKNATEEYGFLWTIGPEEKYYSALGLAGQHIFVFPNQNMLVVFTANLPLGNDADYIPLKKLLDQYILPAVKSEQPLSANPDGVSRLEAGIQALAEPEKTHTSLPAIAREISEKTFLLDDNPFGWQTLVFSFKDEQATAVINDAPPLAIGLDNLYRITTIPDSPFSEALRGHWENNDTLLVEDIVVGQMIEITYRIKFSENKVYIVRHDKYSGSRRQLQGVLSDTE